MFANDYLLKNNRIRIISENPDPDCGMIVVIPCHNEPDILQTLESLKTCIQPEKKAEVLVVINHSESANVEIKIKNQRTLMEVSNWIAKNKTQKIDFFVIGPIELREKWAGVGLARKSGMDEAVARFNFNKNPRGIVVSLDADTLVAQNYLVEIENHFKKNPRHIGATIAFEHQKKGLTKKQLTGIALYEQSLKYYKDALTYTGFPFSMYTIGSAIVVTAEAYVKRGGMNRRQAGEDFYFLQNLVQLGTVGEINTTKVFPSARLSNRVPFGTGAAMQKWIAGTDDLTQTYNFKAFTALKSFFDTKNYLFRLTEQEQKGTIAKLPESIRSFIETDNFYGELADLNKNCSNLKSFQTRFFYKFNAFKILKYLNYVHDHHFEKADLQEQTKMLQKYMQC